MSLNPSRCACCIAVLPIFWLTLRIVYGLSLIFLSHVSIAFVDHLITEHHY